MSFGSDNWAGAHPAVIAALAAANEGLAPAYGNDALTLRALAAVEATFETPCAVAFVPTGTAANALALSCLAPAYGAVICHEAAHIAIDEGNAIGFFNGGARLLTLPGAGGKLNAEALARAAAACPAGNVHGPQPRAVSIANATESGTVYSPEEVAALAAVCRAQGWGLHMDGARLANALAATGVSPADLTWKAGVDALSLGLTKTGALMAEAVVLFGETGREALPYLRKRAGHLLSKHRLASAQALALLEGGLWLKLAAHANEKAWALAAVLEQAGAALIHPVEANEVFARLPDALAGALAGAGIGFYPWPPDGPGAYRFVASWATRDADVAAAAAALAQPGAVQGAIPTRG